MLIYLRFTRSLLSAAHEKEVASLSAQILEAQRQRDQADTALAQLKVKLKVTEEHRDRLERELTETTRALKDGERAVGGGDPFAAGTG